MSTTQQHQQKATRPRRPKARIASATSDERPAGVAEPEYLDLCATCRHADTCTYRGDGNRPVHFCEEFEAEVAESAPPVVSHEETVDQDTIADSEQYLGICSTCERRETCTFPKPEGGVWQCEEFE